MCRILARTGRGAGVRLLTDTEIAARSGSLSKQAVTHVSLLSGWEDVRVLAAYSFMFLGCGLHPRRVSMLRDSLKKSLRSGDPFGTIRKDPRADVLIARVTPEMIVKFVKG